MPDVPTKLDNLIVRATSPDSHIGARLHNHRVATIVFRERTFSQYDDEKALASQLGALLNSLWSAHRQAIRDLLIEGGGSPVDGTTHWDAGLRRYYTERDTQANYGVSAGKLVKVRSAGVTNFEFNIKPGSLASMDEQRCAAEVNSALAAWNSNRQQQTVALADKYLQLNRPTATAVHTPR